MTSDIAEDESNFAQSVGEIVEQTYARKLSEPLLHAIREHRASHSPKDWSLADRRLYEQLPEVDGGR